MGDHARCARVCWRRHKSHRFAGVIVEDLGRNLAGGQHPTHLCHHATRFLHPKAETYELFRTNFGCLEEDGGLAASRSVSRCCSKGFAVSSIRDSGTAKTVHADVTGQWMFQKSAHRTRGKVRRWSVGHQRRTRPPGADGPSRPVTYYRSFLWGGPGRRDRWNSQTNNSPPCLSRHTRLYLRVFHSNRFFTHLINR